MVWPWHHGGRVVYLFLCNGGGKGKDFLYRYFPLAVVVGWKFVAVMVFASLALSRVLAGQPEHVTRWSLVALGCLGNALMFLRIGQHLKALSRRARGGDETLEAESKDVR